MDLQRTVVILDYGIGNIASVANMLRVVGADSVLSADHEVVRRARKIILPGVGSFDAGMTALRAHGLPNAVGEALEQGAYLLGICLGAQLLMEGSDEGAESGLGFIAGRVRRFQFDDQARPVPHMGWNMVRPRPGATLFQTAVDQKRFYFAHSYYLACAREDDVAATSEYGFEFTCALEHGRIFGAQFHPEKSHRFGKEFLGNFVSLPC
ncbi:MAG: imidazole glycerol phosphate synthase subunit HisH [Longimicrobiales bacterium]